MKLYSFLLPLIGALVSFGLLGGPSSDRKSPANVRPESGMTPVSAHAFTEGEAAPVLEIATFKKEQCADCHEDAVASYDRTIHARGVYASSAATFECAGCHGDPSAHIEAGGGEGTILKLSNLSPAAQSETCLSCHEQAGKLTHMRSSEHMQAGVTCVECHEAHPSKDAKFVRTSNGVNPMLKGSQMELCMKCHTQVASEFSMPVHHRLKEGILDCSSCHDMHGSEQPKALKADAKELCISCHQDKRGPFMFEHEAMAEEGCIACHAPHGSAGENMLKVRDPKALCLSCHSKETGVPPHPRMSSSTTVDCTKCHTEVHGSNHNPFLTQ